MSGDRAPQLQRDTATVDIFAPPGITGDLSIQLVKGGSVTVTVDLDLEQIAGSDPNVASRCQSAQHGHLVRTDTSQTLAVGDHFTQAQIDAGIIAFATDDTTYTGTGAGFKVSLSDGTCRFAAGDGDCIACVFDAQINGRRPNNGFDFNADDPISKMGAGVVTSDGAGPVAKFKIAFHSATDLTADRDFTFVGSGFTYGNNGGLTTLTGGIITAIIELDHATQNSIANFSLNVAALDWYSAAVQRAAGNHAPMEALTANWSMNFVGAGGRTHSNLVTVKICLVTAPATTSSPADGNLDRATYTHATGAINVQLADGTVTGNSSVWTDTLRSIEL